MQNHSKIFESKQNSHSYIKRYVEFVIDWEYSFALLTWFFRYWSEAEKVIPPIRKIYLRS